MDVDLHGSLDADEYDAALDRLAAEAADGVPDGTSTDAVWDAVGHVVPQLTAPTCRRVLELAESDPDEALVETVATERASDDAERLRARAVSAIVEDVTARVDGRRGDR